MTRRAPRPILPALTLILTLGLAPYALPAAPFSGGAEAELLKLVPADAAATLAIADLRGHVAEFMDSSFAKSFAALPTVKAWFDAQGGRQLIRSQQEIEQTLGTTLKAIRDDLLGEAVIFALHLPPDAPTESARGLFLARVRDRALLARLIEFADKSDRSIAEITEGGVNERSYKVRHFKPGEPRETEYYRLFDDGTFAWSNSETLIKGVLDRKADSGAGLGDDPAYRKLRNGLPSRAFATLSIHPRFVDRALTAASQTGGSGDARVAENLSKILRAVEGIGLAIEWRDGFVLHAHEVLDPKRLDPAIVHWASLKSSSETLTRRIPGTAIAAAATPIDFVAIFDVLVPFIPGDEQPRFESMLNVLQGILLGRDVRKEVIPQLGPALIGYIEEPGNTWPRFPIVGVLELRDDKREPSIAASLDSALRTLLSLYALDPKRQASRFRLVSRQTGSLRVTSLADPSIPFAYAVGPDVFIVGTSADAVGRFGTIDPDNRPAPFKSSEFSDTRFYAVLDIARLVRIARDHRDDLAKRCATSRGMTTEAALRDLDQALALLNLFGRTSFTIKVDPEMTSIHQTIGLMAK